MRFKCVALSKSGRPTCTWTHSSQAEEKTEKGVVTEQCQSRQNRMQTHLHPFQDPKALELVVILALGQFRLQAWQNLDSSQAQVQADLVFLGFLCPSSGTAPVKLERYTGLVGQFEWIDSRFACESRIFSANRSASLRKKKNLLFANRPSKKWDSSEDWTRITRISMRIGETTQFARIWPSASKISIFLRIDSRKSIRANLRNVGVRIACPLSI